MCLCIFQLLLGRELFLRPVVDLSLLKWTLLDYLPGLDKSILDHEKYKLYASLPHCMSSLHSILLVTCILIDNLVNQSCSALAAGSIWVIKNLVSGITLPKLEPPSFNHT